MNQNISYKEPLQALQDLENNSLFWEKLEDEFIKLRNEIHATLIIKNTISQLQEKNEHIVTRLTVFLERISNDKSSKPKMLIDITTQIISKMLSMQGSKEQGVVATMERECFLLFQRGDSLLSVGDERRFEHAGQKIYLELKHLFFKENGFRANKNKELFLYSKFVQRRSQTVFTATTIVQKCNALLTRSGFDLQSGQQTIVTQFSTMKVTTFSFLFLLLICLFLIYVFLHKNILHPIGHLNTLIGQRTQQVREGRKAIFPLPIFGDHEIREISLSTSFFIKEIESQREALADSHAHLEQQVRRRTERIADLSAKIITIQEEERKRIAAELHDDIGATMSVVKLGVEHIIRLLKQQKIDKNQLNITLQKQKQMVQHVAARLRTIQEDLSPPYLDLGFLEAIEALCEDYTMLHGDIRFKYSFNLAGREVPSHLHLAMYRILQEGMTNIVKHSHATKAAISISYHRNKVVLRIKDNGIPFPETPSSTGMGLKNIEGRAFISQGIVQFVNNEKWKFIEIYWPLLEEENTNSEPV